MARRASIIPKKKKNKNLRITKNEGYIINLKYYGQEPVLTGSITQLDYFCAINWYNATCDRVDAREYINELLVALDRQDDVVRFTKVPDNWLSTTCGWNARLIVNGAQLEDDEFKLLDSFDNLLNWSFEHIDKFDPFTDVKIVEQIDREQDFNFSGNGYLVDLDLRTPEPHWIEKKNEVIDYVDTITDEDDLEEVKKNLLDNNVRYYLSEMCSEHYSSVIVDLIDSIENNTTKKVFGLSEKQATEKALFLGTVVEMFDNIMNPAEIREIKPRKPRKKKVLTPAQILKNFVYQETDDEYNLKSVKPERVLGAQELWTYNTKYKIVTVFRAKDNTGLQVRRTFIENYDENTSISKGAGRKSEKVVSDILTSGKIVLKKYMEALKTDKSLQHRINENTVLLRVI